MAQGHPLAEDLLERVARANHSNSRRLVELRAHEYPSDVPVEFIDLLQTLQAGVARTLDGLRTKLAQSRASPGDTNLETVIRRYGHLVYYMHSLLEVVDEARVEYVSQSAVILVGQLSRKLKDVRFLVIPQYEYNFSYEEVLGSLRSIFRDAITGEEGAGEDVSELIDSFGNSLAILRFPQAERNGIMLNVMLAHEVGHTFVRLNNLVEPLLGSIQLDQKAVEELVESFMEVLTPRGKTEVTLPEFFRREKVKSWIMEMVSTTIESWTEELICDAMAFASIGPCYLLSFAEFLMSIQDLDSFQQTHPPARMRLKLLLSMMERYGYSATFGGLGGRAKEVFIAANARVGEIKAMIERAGRQTEKSPSQLAGKHVEDLTDNIVKTAEVATAEYRYDSARLAEDIPEMCEMLSQFVPPCVRYVLDRKQMNPASPISVLNAGTLFRLARMEAIYSIFGARSLSDRLDVDTKFDSLVSKATELAFIFDLMRRSAAPGE